MKSGTGNIQHIEKPAVENGTILVKDKHLLFASLVHSIVFLVLESSRVGQYLDKVDDICHAVKMQQIQSKWSSSSTIYMASCFVSQFPEEIHDTSKDN